MLAVYRRKCVKSLYAVFLMFMLVFCVPEWLVSSDPGFQKYVHASNSVPMLTKNGFYGFILRYLRMAMIQQRSSKSTDCFCHSTNSKKKLKTFPTENVVEVLIVLPKTACFSERSCISGWLIPCLLHEHSARSNFPHEFLRGMSEYSSQSWTTKLCHQQQGLRRFIPCRNQKTWNNGINKECARWKMQKALLILGIFSPISLLRTTTTSSTDWWPDLLIDSHDKSDFRALVVVDHLLSLKSNFGLPSLLSSCDMQSVCLGAHHFSLLWAKFWTNVWCVMVNFSFLITSLWLVSALHIGYMWCSTSSNLLVLSHKFLTCHNFD